MEPNQVMLVYLVNNTFLISEVEELVASDIGQPDCKLINPYTLDFSGKLEPWLFTFTKDEYIMISSDKILTIVEPNTELIEKYLEVKQ